MNAFVYTEISHDPIIKHILFLKPMDIFSNYISSKLMNLNFFQEYGKYLFQADCSCAAGMLRHFNFHS